MKFCIMLCFNIYIYIDITNKLPVSLFAAFGVDMLHTIGYIYSIKGSYHMMKWEIDSYEDPSLMYLRRVIVNCRYDFFYENS
jgi:hypothetical protein